jgi:ketosteroid isomerase-like protein
MLRRLWLGGTLTAGAVAVVALTVALSACGGTTSVSSEVQEQVDKFLIGEIERDFHEALSKKDIDQMMSLWSQNATFTAGPGKTATGREQIQQFWLNSEAFKPSTEWVSDHPAYKLRVTVGGDRGTLHFECHFVDVTTGDVAQVTAGDLEVARIDGRWLITNMVGGTAELSP